MKKILLFLLPVVLAVIVFLGFVFFLKQSVPGKGGLQVTSIPQSTVYVNGKVLGKTPLCKCEPADMLPAGEYTLRLVSADTSKQPYEEKITLNQSVLTAVDRIFGDVGKSSGFILTLTPISDTKTAQLFVSTFPYGADVSIDSNQSGSAPLLLDHITGSDHEITISKSGYQSKTIPIHGVLGYKLNAVVSLATDLTPPTDATPPSPSGSIIPSVSATPQPSISPSSALQGPQVTILDTPTGFLRVRDSASLGGNEIAQVHPGETYQYVSDQDGWFQIKLSDGKVGWVSSSYAKKL